MSSSASFAAFRILNSGTVFGFLSVLTAALSFIFRFFSLSCAVSPFRLYSGGHRAYIMFACTVGDLFDSCSFNRAN